MTHYQKISLRHTIDQTSTLTPKLTELLEHEFSPLLTKDSDLARINDEFLQEHHTSAPHIQSALRVRVKIIDPSTKEKSSQDIIRTLALEQSNLPDAKKGLETLRELNAETKYIDDFLAAAHARYPEANAFMRKDNGKAS